MLFSAFYGKEALYVLHNFSKNPEKILFDKTAIRFAAIRFAEINHLLIGIEFLFYSSIMLTRGQSHAIKYNI